MSDASGRDDAPVVKISKEEQEASPALEHGTNDNSIDTHANESAKSKDGGNHSKHNARLTEIRMPQQTLLNGKLISNNRTSIRRQQEPTFDGDNGDLDSIVISPCISSNMSTNSWFNQPISTSIKSLLMFCKLKLRVPARAVGLCKSSNRHQDLHEDGLFQQQRKEKRDSRSIFEEDGDNADAVSNDDGTRTKEERSRLDYRLERDGIQEEEHGSSSRNHVDTNMNNEPMNELLNQAAGNMPIMMPVQQDEDQSPSHSNLKIYNHDESSSMMLIVAIRHIGISHHPLFVEEEKHAVDLMHLFEKFKDLNEKRDVEYYCKKIAAIVSKLSAMRKQVSKEDEEKSDDRSSTVCNNKVHNLYDDIMSYVSKMISTEDEIYNVYISILKKWTQVSEAREQQGFQCTTVSLTKKSSRSSMIYNNGVDIESLQASMDDMISWIGDILPANAAVNRNYQQELKSIIWMMQVIHSARSSQFDLALAHGDESTLSNIANFTDEQKRRGLVGSEKYIAKLFVNGAFVESTGATSIDWPNWSIDFNQTFCCSLCSEPTVTCVQIYRRRLMGFAPDELVCSTFLAVPGSTTRLDFCSLHMLAPSVESYRFQNAMLRGEIEVSLEWQRSDVVAQQSGDRPNIDTGINLRRLQGTRTHPTIHDMKKGNFSASAQISLNEHSMSFRMPGTRFPFTNSQRFQEPLRHYLIKQRELHGTADLIPLEEGDISADTIKNLIADRKSKYRSQDDLVEKACKERIFVDAEKIKNYITCIQQCLQQDRSDRESKVAFEDVVHDESRIRAQDPRADFSWILNAIIPPRKRSLYPARQHSNIFETQGTHTQLQQQSRMIVTVVSASDTLCREQAVFSNATPFLASPPPIRRLKSSDISSFMTKPSPRRIPDSEAIRRHQGLSSQEREATNRGDLNTIVQLKFCGKKYETRPDRKVNPSWKQVIEIPLPFNEEEKDGGFTPAKLKELDESLQISLFDIVSVDIGKGGGYYDDEVTVFTEKRFLGSVQIPLGPAFNEDKQQGTYILNTPDIILGYTPSGGDMSDTVHEPSSKFPSRRPNGFAPGSRAGDVESQLHGNTIMDDSNRKRSASLSMLVAIEPSVPMMEHSQMIVLPSNESPTLSQYATEWMQRYTKINPCGPKRRINILVNGSNRKQNIITRFLRSQPPPPECQASLSQCAHYVSLIPFLKTWKAFKNIARHKIWRTSQNVLDITAADWNERAALLANYFIYMSQEGNLDPFEVYLVVGNSITEGNVTYVMTRQSNNYNRIHIWNPSTGKSFAEDDEKCPLINISLLAGPEDIIYANLQTEGKPCVIDFDLQDNRCWDPFFASPGLKPYDEETLPAPSIQEPILDYKEPNDDLAAILESEILERVKSSIRSWRRIPSSFNNEISYRLRIIIDDLEERKLNGMPPPPSTEYYTPLEGLSLSRGKKMFGFPLHSGFTSVTDILDKLHSTAIHESQHPEVEFSAAVRVFPYACDVFSVWVFVCSLVSEY